jgi:phosphodiesterase/alkaline phosphatase D-like protein
MRRSLLLVFLISAASALALPAAAGAATAVFTHGVASGDVTDSRAILWTRVDRPANIKVEVWPESSCLTGQKAFQSKDKTTSAARDFTIKVDATGLDPGTEYCYRFRRGDEAASPVGHFKTAPNSDTAADLRFTYSGDSDSTHVSGVPCCGTHPVLDQARLTGGDFFVWLGDTIYSDSSHRTTGPATTLDEYRDAYKEARSIQAVPDLLASQALWAQLDDHEVQNDFDGQTVNPARYAAGRQAFLEYMPIRETGLPNDPTCAGDPLYRTVKWGSDVELFIPDERSCKSADVAVQCGGDLGPTLPTSLRTTPPFNFFLAPSPPAGCLTAIFDPSRTVLGPVQKNQLKNDLLNSTAEHKIVINEFPIQQYHALPYDRWEGYGAERNEILDFISNNGIDNVVFATTDTHATIQNEVFKDRFTAPATVAYEGVTGPIATNTLQTEIVNTFGPVALTAFQLILSVDGIDCRNLDRDSYGDVSYSTGSGQVSLSSKDDTGALVTNSIFPLSGGTPNPCTKTLGP